MSKICNSCGAENVNEAMFCKKCGGKFIIKKHQSTTEQMGMSHDDKYDISEEDFYEAAMEEVETNTLQKGLWAKALSLSEGNREKTEALYIKFRVQGLKLEKEAEQLAQQEKIRVQKEVEKRIEEERLTKEKRIKMQKEDEDGKAAVAFLSVLAFIFIVIVLISKYY